MTEADLAPVRETDAEDEGLPRASAAALYGFMLLFIVGLFPGPLATWLVWFKRRDEPFIDWHGRQALDLIIAAALGGLLFLVGRVIEPNSATASAAIQWAALAIVAAQFFQAAWGLFVAARGGTKHMALSLHIMRRAIWANQAMG